MNGAFRCDIVKRYVSAISDTQRYNPSIAPVVNTLHCNMTSRIHPDHVNESLQFSRGVRGQSGRIVLLRFFTNIVSRIHGLFPS